MATSDGSITYNYHELHNLASELGTKASGIRSEFEFLIDAARGMSTSGLWTGEINEAFMMNIENYKKEHVDGLLQVMDDYVKEIATAADTTEAQTAKGVAMFS